MSNFLRDFFRDRNRIGFVDDYSITPPEFRQPHNDSSDIPNIPGPIYGPIPPPPPPKKYFPIDINKIKVVDFPESQYYNQNTNKNQVVLHHTVSSAFSIEGDLSTWLSDTPRVATCIIIDFYGTPHQLFSSKKWAHHLGVKATDLRNMGFSDYGSRNLLLNKSSIGIEIDSPGGLTYDKNTNKFHDWYGNTIDRSKYQIVEYDQPFMGYKYFVKYSQAQIDTVAELLLYWNQIYGIPLNYNEDMWDISMKALSSTPGVWTHVSYRGNTKSDCHPDPDLIKMLKSLV